VVGGGKFTNFYPGVIDVFIPQQQGRHLVVLATMKTAGLLLLLVALFKWECTRSEEVVNSASSLLALDNLKAGSALPVFPAGMKEEYDPSVEIPLNIWVTTRYPALFKFHESKLIELNKDCNFHVLGDDQMNEFMTTTFANTSVLWAYQMISPKLFAAKADIWRIATLWVNGDYT
jgi:mannosyltransferase OCH1-like enzyme